MKIVSPVGILRIVCTVFGIAAIVVGVISAIYCKSFGIYRRGFMDRNHFKTRMDYMRPRPPKDGKVPERLHGCHAHPWENGEWDQHSFTLLMVYFIVAPLAFAISTSLFGFQIGKPEREGCKKPVDLGLHGVCFFFALIGGLCLIAAAVVPDMVKQDDNNQDAKLYWQLELELERQGKSKSDIENSITRCLTDINGTDFYVVYDKKMNETFTGHEMYDLWTKENRNKLLKLYQTLGKAMYDAEVKNNAGDKVKISDVVINYYRDENNFLLRLIAGGINALYAVLLLVLTIMIGLGLRKPKVKVTPIVEVAPVIEAPPPPPEEPVEGAEGGEEDSIAPAPVPSADAPPPPEA